MLYPKLMFITSLSPFWEWKNIRIACYGPWRWPYVSTTVFSKTVDLPFSANTLSEASLCNMSLRYSWESEESLKDKWPCHEDLRFSIVEMAMPCSSFPSLNFWQCPAIIIERNASHLSEFITLICPQNLVENYLVSECVIGLCRHAD